MSAAAVARLAKGIRMKRAGPLVQMTVALVALTGTLLLLAHLFFGLLPDRDAQQMQLRKRLGESLAVQVAALLQLEEGRALELTLRNVVARDEAVRSLAIRRTDGRIVMQAGDHDAAWRATPGDRSRPDQVVVPLNAGSERWGSFEIAYRGDGRSALARWFGEPLVLTMLFLSSAGALVFGLYLRRVLQHLDPSSVIPERVQGAFDALAAGVVVLDARGRLLLANKAFRGMHAQAPALRTGSALSSVDWLADSLGEEPAGHPWTRALGARMASSGHSLVLAEGTPQARQLLVGSAPITDAGGHVRGCLTTFDDVTELHVANQRLRDAMSELSASKDEIERQNGELQRLATRDPLTGCLNRRAFHQAFESMLAQAREHGTALSCVMLDIDHFKSINDTHGHAIGDRVIQEVARKLNESARATDLVCRYGGEEFCVVVPGMDLSAVLLFADRVRERVERECGNGVREVEGLRVTVSVGVDALASPTQGAAALIDRADQALYRAKRSGRNRVCHLMGAEAAPAPAQEAH
jgi:diguanylate cyclase (GGDEF)-like protein